MKFTREGTFESELTREGTFESELHRLDQVLEQGTFNVLEQGTFKVLLRYLKVLLRKSCTVSTKSSSNLTAFDA